MVIRKLAIYSFVGIILSLNIDLNALINVFYMYFVGHTKKRMLLEQGYDNNKKVS